MVSNINDLINKQNISNETIAYLTTNPAELTTLIKKNFGLALDYLKYLTEQDPTIFNTFVKNAQAKHQNNWFFAYTFMTDLINILILMKTSSVSSNPVISNVSYKHHLKQPFIDLQDTLVFIKQQKKLFNDEYDYFFQYPHETEYYNEIILESDIRILKNAQSIVVSENLSFFIERWRTDCLRRKAVQEKLTPYLITMLNTISSAPQGSPNLDFEFTKFFGNDSIPLLAQHQLFDIIPALLKCLSPAVAVSQLMLKCDDNDHSTVLAILLRQKQTAALAVAIECMKNLKDSDQKAFEAFIKLDKGFDLLHELSIVNSNLAQQCFEIDHEFMRSQFLNYKSTNSQLAPLKLVAPTAPPNYEQSLIQQPVSSSSSSTASPMTLGYNPPAVANKDTGESVGVNNYNSHK